MRKLITLLLLLGTAQAENFYGQSTNAITGSTVKDLTTGNPAPDDKFSSSGSAVSATYLSMPMQAGSTGTVWFSAGVWYDGLGTRYITFYVESTDSGGGNVTAICNSGAIAFTNGYSTATGSCAGGATQGANGRLRLRYSTTAAGGSPEYYTIEVSGPAMTTATTMFYCPTQGAACACNGICAGAACGIQYSTANVNTCSCDCAGHGATCSGLTIAGPGSLWCSDALDASHLYVGCGAVANGDGYNISRSGVGIVSSGPTSYTDNPGVGVWTYYFGAWGHCDPASGVGDTVWGVATQTTGPITCFVRGRGSVISVF